MDLEGQALSPLELAVLTPNAKTRFVVLGGESLEAPRFMWWNFVSSRKERLEQAREDWKARRFPLTPR